MAQNPIVGLAALESERFGIKVARAPGATRENLGEILEFCRKHKMEFLVARCAGDDIPAARALEDAGARLADTQLHYYRRPFPLPERDRRIEIRPVEPGEKETLAAVARAAFRDYRGHFQQDPALAGICPAAELYSSWALDSLARRGADGEVWLARREGKPIAFACARRLGPEDSDLTLGGGIPSSRWRGKAIRELILEGLAWSGERGCRRVRGCVLISNLAIQRILAGLSYRPERAFHTFHLRFGGANERP